MGGLVQVPADWVRQGQGPTLTNTAAKAIGSRVTSGKTIVCGYVRNLPVGSFPMHEAYRVSPQASDAVTV